MMASKEFMSARDPEHDLGRQLQNHSLGLSSPSKVSLTN